MEAFKKKIDYLQHLICAIIHDYSFTFCPAQLLVAFVVFENEMHVTTKEVALCPLVDKLCNIHSKVEGCFSHLFCPF